MLKAFLGSYSTSSDIIIVLEELDFLIPLQSSINYLASLKLISESARLKYQSVCESLKDTIWMKKTGQYNVLVLQKNDAV